MNVSDKLHGAALMQIIKHPSFTALNRAPDRTHGHYTINDKIRVLMKYDRSNGKTPESWDFRLYDKDIERLKDAKGSKLEVFLVLLCGCLEVKSKGVSRGREFACALNWDHDIGNLLDLTRRRPRQQVLRVERQRNTQIRVSSARTGRPGLTIPQSSYPCKLLT